MHTTLMTVAVLALLAPPVETSPARTTRLYVRTLPPGASIKLDGRPRGVGDQLFVVPPGVRKVTVEVEWDPGETQQRVVQIEGGRITRAEFQWSPPEQKPPQPPLPPLQTSRLRAAEQPPVVVHTEPSSGDRAVDPSTSEIRVTFSKEMTDGNWSWTTLSPETFPELTGEPRYLPDKRTCVLSVKLELGQVYATWINSDKFVNFQDSEGRPAVPYLLIFETADKVGRDAEPAAEAVSPTGFKIPENAVRLKVAATIALLKNALQAYRLDLGTYPTSDQGLKALCQAPADLAKPGDWKGPYLKDAAGLDPWGAAYQYRSPGKKDPGGFDLWSFGPDGVDGTEDDVAE